MKSLLLAPILRFARGLRFRTLFALTAALFVLSVLIPDPLPFIDEIVLGLGSALLASYKRRPTHP